MLKKILLPTLGALLCVSCTHEFKDIVIRTQPDGATIRINGVEKEAKTPFATTINQRENLAIVAEKKGYVTATRNIIPESDGFLSIIWTDTDERTRYIKEDEIMIPMKKIVSSKSYKPSEMPSYNPPFMTASEQEDSSLSEPPALRPIPKF